MSTETSAPNASNYEALEVPGEPGVYFCARHRKVKVRLRCGRCETPICARCTMMTPVGARCRNCGLNRSSHIYQLSPLQILIALSVSVALGALGALFIAKLPFIAILTVLYSPALGALAGKVVVRATGGKRGTKTAAVSVAGFAIGALLLTLALGASLLNPWLWIFIGLSGVGAWYWIR